MMQLSVKLAHWRRSSAIAGRSMTHCQTKGLKTPMEILQVQVGIPNRGMTISARLLQIPQAAWLQN